MASFETLPYVCPDVFFGGKRVAMRNVSSGTIYYYEEDMLGSSRTMVQAGQTSVCYDADFYPFGGERDITSTCTQNYKFEGKERDTETGNDDFGARYYTSRLGRWLSADWSGVPAPVPYANLTNPQTLNLYAMVSDNPETFDDLDGHDGGGICDVNRNGCPNSGQSTNAPPPTGGKDPKSNSPNTGTGSVGQSDAQKAQQAQQQNATGTLSKEQCAAAGCGGMAQVPNPATAQVPAVNVKDALIFMLQAVTVISAVFDEGASLAALPEEEGLEVGAEATETEATSAEETAGGGPGAAKDRTLQGSQDRLEGLKQKQEALTNRKGYRISTKGTEQDLDHTLKQIARKSSSDIKDQ